MFFLAWFQLLCCFKCLISFVTAPSDINTQRIEEYNQQRLFDEELEKIQRKAETIVAKQEVNRLKAKSDITGKNMGHHYVGNTPTMTHHNMQKGDPSTYYIDARQARYEEMLKMFRTRNYSHQQMNYATKKIIGSPQDIECDPTYPFRTIDGSCNNLKHPTWGMHNSCFNRLMPAYYADGISQLRKAKSGKDLPTPRSVVVTVHGYHNVYEYEFSHMFMQFGQFIDHDMVKSPFSTKPDGSPIICCTKTEDSQCGDLILAKDDPFYGSFNLTCLPNPRTQRCNTCNFGPREQTKALTAFMDGSMVYDNTEETANKLRSFKHGKMKSFHDENYGELLPRVPRNSTCKDNNHDRCFICGDTRCNQHPALNAFHTLFVRLHNKCATELRKYNPHWDDERLYQEARRIVGAVLQCIMYKEYISLVIGQKAMDEWGLNVGEDSEYNPDVNPTILNEFSTAAFRFGHSTISTFAEVHPNGGVDDFDLRDFFTNIFGFYHGQLERVTKGLLISPSLKFNRYVSKDVTNHLVQSRGTCYGMDLISLNIFRGRDHGIPPYTEVLKHFNGPANLKSFEDLENRGIISKGLARILASVYESVHDIDLFTAGLLEIPETGCIVGPTFNNILSPQFYNLKYGDRFYFEHKNQNTSFTKEQRNELRRITLSEVLCNLDVGIEYIQSNAFLLPNKENPIKACSKRPLINFQLWQDKA